MLARQEPSKVDRQTLIRVRGLGPRNGLLIPARVCSGSVSDTKFFLSSFFFFLLFSLLFFFFLQVSSIFELADHWTETLEVEEYVSFLEFIFVKLYEYSSEDHHLSVKGSIASRAQSDHSHEDVVVPNFIRRQVDSICTAWKDDPASIGLENFLFLFHCFTLSFCSFMFMYAYWY